MYFILGNFYQESTGSGGLGRETPNYGKFYKTAYLDLKDGFKRGPSINSSVTDTHPQHFHRPGNIIAFLCTNCIAHFTKHSYKIHVFYYFSLYEILSACSYTWCVRVFMIVFFFKRLIIPLLTICYCQIFYFSSFRIMRTNFGQHSESATSFNQLIRPGHEVKLHPHFHCHW